MNVAGVPIQNVTAERIAFSICPRINAAGRMGSAKRAVELLCDDEISIGDYVLTGGEIPACILVDCVSRLVDGVLSDPECFSKESLSDGLLEYPQYTRPAVWMGKEVPAILLSGDHKKVEEWRLEQSVKRTRERRPDMYEKLDLSSKQDKKLLKEMEQEDAAENAKCRMQNAE